MGDIGNAYLNDNTEVNIYTLAGAEFELVGIMSEETLLEVVKELYVFTTSGSRWHVHLSRALRGVVFKPTHFDPNVWIKRIKGGYDCIGTHTDKVLAIFIYRAYIFNKLKETGMIKDSGAPKVHLGCD